MNKVSAVILAIFVMLSSIHSSAQQSNNKVIMGEGFEKDQKSQKVLNFTAPSGWSDDAEAARKLGLYRVLVPQGSTLQNANKAITVAFQRKDVTQAGLENLENFARVDLQQMITQFPNAQFARWQPSKLDPDKIRFWSIEIFGKKKDQPSPQRVVIIDSGDGYFSLTLTASIRSELQGHVYDDFFNSISLSGK